MTLMACNSAEGQQSEARLFQGIAGHINSILMSEGSEINLFTYFDPWEETEKKMKTQ